MRKIKRKEWRIHVDNKKIPDKSGNFLVVQLEEQLLGIDGVLVQSDHDSVDQTEQAAQAQQVGGQANDALLGLAEHEAVDAQTAHEQSDSKHQPLILAANFHK